MRGARTLTMAGLALLATLAAAGCARIHDARQVMDRAQLVDDLAGRLDQAATARTYTATYRLAGGQTATIAQAKRPTRVAYTYPGGKVVIDGTATTACVGRASGGVAAERQTPARCTLTAPRLSTSAPPADALDPAIRAGLVYPQVVMGLLTSAALDGAAEIDRTGATIAGQQATCVDVRPAGKHPPAENDRPFTACITADGVLGSFAGTLRGKPTTVSLISYTTTVPDGAFELPAGATVIDRRD